MNTYRDILNDEGLRQARDAQFRRLAQLFAGEHGEHVFVLMGVNGWSKTDLYTDPEGWVAGALEDLATKAEALRDRNVFRPLAISVLPFGVHLVNTFFGARAFEADDWWADYLTTPVGELVEPDVEAHPSFQIISRIALAFVNAGVSVPVFDAPCLSSPLNMAINLYGQEFLIAMLAEPEKARHDLRVIANTMKRLNLWYQKHIPFDQFQMALSCGRIQPPGHGQLCGCSCHLVSGEQYREFIAPLDSELLALHPGGGMLHLCGSHAQHIPTWKAMPALRAVQINNRAAEDIALYLEGLREDQIMYVNPCDTMPVSKIMDITGGHRTVIVADIKEPIPMKPASRLLSISVAAGLLASQAPAAQPTTVVTVKPDVTVTEPASPELFSSFIELAFGRTENILAELLYDRGFETHDTHTLNRGWCTFVKPKPEMEDWWHSGYEEHRWHLAKAKDDAASTMQKCTDTWPSPPNGKFYLRMENKSTNSPISLAQDGIRIEVGVAYEFSGLMCDGTMFSATPTAATPVPVEVCLFPEGKLDGPPITSATIMVDATTCRKSTATLPAGTYTGRATFALRIGPGKKLVCDMLSLMPATHVGGIRREVIETMKQVPSSVTRFPGGCFASTYHWRDGIGDRDTRPVDFHNWWDNPMLNDFGTVEFVTLCRAIGSEPMLCVPVMFDDAENAADWVAFCNTTNHPLHRKAGITAPLRVLYWELDNETYRRMDAITYAHRCVEFSRAMKQVDPTIKIIMNCYWVYHSALKQMLDIAGPDIDLVNNRGGNIAELRGDLAVLAAYNAAHKRDISLCHSEYRANNYDLPTETSKTDDADGLNQPNSEDKKDTILAKASRWSYGLSVLCDFLEYQGFGGKFRFANFTNYTDGWGESLVNCGKSKVYLSAAGEAFAFLQRQHMAWPLAIETNAVALLRVQAAWDAGKKTMIVVVLNLGSTPKTLSLDLSKIKGCRATTATVESLSASAPNVVNKEDCPSAIKNEHTDVAVAGNVCTVISKPWSATVVRVPCQ